MKKSVKVTSLVVLSVALICAAMFSGCGSSSSSDSTPAPVATTYSGTLYMASESGGHVGVFPITIDPSKAEPITVDTANVGRIQITTQWSNPTRIKLHDVRLDGNKLYYSAFFTGPSNTTGESKASLGYVDLTTAKTDGTINQGVNSSTQIEAGNADTIAFALQQIGVGTGIRAIYCASGQSPTHYFPMTMSFPAYIDVFSKAGLATAGTQTPVQRITIDKIDAQATLGTGPAIPEAGGQQLGNPPLAFLHGATNKAGTKMYLASNQMAGLNLTTNLDGHFKTYLINTADLVDGSMVPSKVIVSKTHTVAPSLASIAYRSAFSSDAAEQYILQAGSDRLLILNSNDLSVYVDTHITNTTGTVMGGGKTGIDNHDAMTTPDGKYAILSLRYQDSAGSKTTSGIQLYDIANKKFIGGIAPTCGANASACHVAAGDTKDRMMCGIVTKFN